MTRIALVLSALLFHSSMAGAQEPVEWNESWRWCQFSHHCEVLKDECGNWGSVNKDYVPYAEKYYDYARPLVDCGEPFLLPPPKPACNVKARRCEVSYE